MTARQLNLIILATLISPTMVFLNEIETSQWLINPKSNVGKIVPKSSEQDLMEAYGRENVKRSKISIGEGEFVEGTTLFPDTENELLIEWKDDFKNPRNLTIQSDQADWKLDNGIKIGTMLSKIEKLNSTPFKLTGFEWDYPGRTVSWEKGKLPTQLQLELEPSVDLPEKERYQVVGDSSFSSSNAIIKKMKLKVRTIYIRWD